MASIKYTSIINSFVSTEGSGGFMTNYVYYTILVAYTDGRKDIVEGKLGEIKPFLAFARTPMDYLSELQDAVKGLRNEVDQKIDYVIDSLYPIPNIQGVNEVDAVNEIIKSGLTPIFENEYPESTPQNGTVRAYSRNKKDFRSVNVRIVRDYPNVKGMRSEEALKTLSEAGFTADLSYTLVTEKADEGVVLECSRADENKLNVSLGLGRFVPDVKGMAYDNARKLLEEAGFEVKREQVLTDELSPNTVINWANDNDNIIKIKVSSSNLYTATAVNVRWSNMQDSNGDSYSATAKLDKISNKLKVDLTYKSGAKSKHTITKCSCTMDNKDVSDSITVLPTQLDAAGTLRICALKLGSAFPQYMHCILYTNYGMLQKADPISLHLEFKW